jgi:hypothetical protein
VLLGDLGVYLIGGLIGALASGPVPWLIARNSNANDTHAIVTAGVIGSVVGGFLGVAVIGPIGQLAWRVISDTIVADPEQSGNYIWPYPVSLWYSSLFVGALVSGLWTGLLAALVAKHRLDRQRT